MQISFVFFDLDGTLTDPGMGITGGVMHALSKFGIEEKDRTKLFSFIGPPLLESFHEKYGFSKEQSLLALGYYREYYEKQGIFENEIYPGIPEMLSVLQQAGKKLVLATSKPEMYARKILEHFNILQYFEFVAGSLPDEQRSRKGEVIAYALEGCRINDSRTALMVGDRSYDIAGAKENGMKSAGVLYGYGDRLEMEAAGADYITETVVLTQKLILGI